MSKLTGYPDSSGPDALSAKVVSGLNRAKWVVPAIIILGLAACGGGGGGGGTTVPAAQNVPTASNVPVSQSNTVLKGTYTVLKASTVPVGAREFYAQDLLAAREESTGTLKMAYEGALARFAEKNGRNPQDDLETAAAICDWVAFNLRHPHFYPEDQSLPRFYQQLSPSPAYNSFVWDPAKIISYTLQFDMSDAVNWPSPFCTQQSFAAAGIMNYAGLHARLCYVEGHDGLEYYSWKYKKWIWCEATFNEHLVLPLPDGTFLPLGAKEMQELTFSNEHQQVQTVKHGYPDGSIPGYSYLNVHPHGFRRYAPFRYMQTLNGLGSKVGSPYISTSNLPIPATYLPAADEIADFVIGPRLTLVNDPLLLDAPLNALTLGDSITPEREELAVNLRTWLPYATRFEIQYGPGMPWQTLELISAPSATSRTSSVITLPWTAGVVNIRAMDNIGNVSETLTILLERS